MTLCWHYENIDGVRTKQLTIPEVMTGYIIYPEGVDSVRFGQYEAFKITHENGLPVGRTVPCITPTEPVRVVTLADGRLLVFDEPFYCVWRDTDGRWS